VSSFVDEVEHSSSGAFNERNFSSHLDLSHLSLRVVQMRCASSSRSSSPNITLIKTSSLKALNKTFVA
jgi:hypothetical protein